MRCENCNDTHNGSYGSGRFCSSKCARGFSTKGKRKEINKSVSNKLKGRKPHDKGFKAGFDPRRRLLTDTDRERATKSLQENRDQSYKSMEWDDLPLAEKRRRVLFEQNGKCISCGIDSWLGKPITIEYHHIDGNNINDSRDNVEYRCPNCHSQTDTFRNRKRL
jgi:hypothetical protein